MCLIITWIAAFVSFCAWRFLRVDFSSKFFSLGLIYLGAALMWLADCFFAKFVMGEEFFDLSADDAQLGLLVVVAGFVIWAIFQGILRIRSANTAAVA